MLKLILAALLSASDPVETEVRLDARPAALFGSWVMPEASPRAAAVLISGSGPTDRDGNSPLGVQAGYLRLLAKALAVEGIATVRFDKRGVGASAAAGPGEEDLRFETYVEDARAWAAETARLTGQSCVWLVGHSEGALVAQAAAADDHPGICGLVLLAGAGRPAATILAEQLAALPEPLRAQAIAVTQELAAGRTVACPPGLESLCRPSVQPYLISWFAYDPAALAAAFHGPLLIAYGSTDLQVGSADALALRRGQPKARVVEWDGVNHVLKSAPADRAANLAAYANPDLPLAPGVAANVAVFILEPRPSQSGSDSAP